MQPGGPAGVRWALHRTHLPPLRAPLACGHNPQFSLFMGVQTGLPNMDTASDFSGALVLLQPGADISEFQVTLLPKGVCQYKILYIHVMQQ